MDPCAALQTSFELANGARTQVLVLLGEADGATAAADLIRRGRTADHEALLREVASYWDDVQGTVQVRTPDRSMDILLNRWLLYQTLSCRLWARTAFYQAGGAYGFRDQLQDVIALVTAKRGPRPRASPPGRGAPVRRGRRPALVASAVGPGRPHPHLRRSSLAAVRGRSLPRGHGRLGAARRDGPVPGGTRPAPEARRTPTSSRNARPQSASLFDHCAAALDRSLQSAPTGCR